MLAASSVFKQHKSNSNGQCLAFNPNHNTTHSYNNAFTSNLQLGRIQTTVHQHRRDSHDTTTSDTESHTRTSDSKPYNTNPVRTSGISSKGQFIALRLTDLQYRRGSVDSRISDSKSNSSSTRTCCIIDQAQKPWHRESYDEQRKASFKENSKENPKANPEEGPEDCPATRGHHLEHSPSPNLQQDDAAR